MSTSQIFSGMSVEDTTRELNCNTETGLDERDAMSRWVQYGSNELCETEKESILKKFLEQFTESPLILMLIASAFISLCLGNAEDAISITVAIVFVVGVGFIQEYRSEQSLKALGSLVPPSAHLIRDSKNRTVLANTLVPGDLVQISVGDRVPADLRLVEAVHLSIDESTLTGETLPVDKTVAQAVKSDGFADRSNIAFMGTLVTSGRGLGIVVSTGRNTEFGNIFTMMNDIVQPKTPLQSSMDKLGHQLSMLSFGIIGVICLIGVFQGRKVLEMFQIGVSLAVAAIPEGLPIIVTVTLALGVLRMAKSNAIVRRLPSVETLGSVNVICSDKTGTLTMNMLHVAEIFCPSNPEWIDLRKYSVNSQPSIPQNLLDAALYCNDAQKQNTGDHVGNSVDISLLKFLENRGCTDDRNLEENSRVLDIPFSSSRQWMSVSLKRGGTYLKGAYEKVLPICTHYIGLNGKRIELTPEMRDTIKSKSEHMAGSGMRIIALASSDKSTQSEEDIADLCLCGLAAMYDPPRPGVANTIERLRRSGVRVIMITGDNDITAVAAAREVGIPIPSDFNNYVMLGRDLEKLSPDQLANAVKSTLVFARTSPEMKVLIVEALQSNGNIVAMTGDGVNDAPALKLADIGVAMGSGTDVAKEAGDMILVNNDFSTILQAIREGKAIFTNIKSFLTFQLSTSVAALSLIVFSTLFKVPNPLNAMQVLWINILMDGPPAQSLGVEPADPDEMKKPPRSRNDDVLEPRIIKSVLWRGAVILIGTMYVYIREMKDGVVTARDTTMSFTTFVLFDLFNALSVRSATRSVFQIGIFSNKMFNFAVGMSLLGQIAVIYTTPFQKVFQTEALLFSDLVYIICLTSSILWVDEGTKWLRNKTKPNMISAPI